MTTTWSLTGVVLYIVQGLAWSAGGFFAGLLFMRQKQRIDRVSDDVERIKEVVVTESTDEQADDLPDEEDHGLPDSWKRLFGIVLVVLSIFTVGQAWYFSDRDRQITECLARQAQAFQEAQVDRAQVGDQDRLVVDQMVITISHATTGEETRKALQAYLAARAKNDAERAKSPLPAINTCGTKGGG